MVTFVFFEKRVDEGQITMSMSFFSCFIDYTVISAYMYTYQRRKKNFQVILHQTWKFQQYALRDYWVIAPWILTFQGHSQKIRVFAGYQKKYRLISYFGWHNMWNILNHYIQSKTIINVNDFQRFDAFKVRFFFDTVVFMLN